MRTAAAFIAFGGRQGTAANVADLAQTHALLHGAEQEGYADAGYLGVENREEMATRHPRVAWRVDAKRGKVKAIAEVERRKAQVRARVEHPFSRPQEPLP